MNKHIYDSLNLEYEKKRNRVLTDAENKMHELMEQHPALKELDEQIKQEGLSALKNLLQKGIDDSDVIINNLESKIQSLKEKREALLRKYDVSPEDLVPEYECNICKDIGFKESGEMCSCYKQKLLNLAYKQKNLALTSVENFKSFDIDLYSDETDKERFGTQVSPRANILKVKNASLDFINNFDSLETKNLMFVGEPGRGKTFLSNCIAKELLDRGKTVIYQTASKLLDLVLSYKMRFERPDYFNEHEYEDLFKVDLLIIDDLGAEAQSSTRFSELFDIINTRILTQKTRNTKTILSTNLPLEKFREYYDQRIVSRVLGEFDIYKVYGEDIRIKKR